MAEIAKLKKKSFKTKLDAIYDKVGLASLYSQNKANSVQSSPSDEVKNIFSCQQWVTNSRWYNLKSLQLDEDNYYTIKNGDQYYFYNFCETFDINKNPVEDYQTDSCPATETFGVSYTDTDPYTCVDMTSEDTSFNITAIPADEDPDNNDPKGVKLTYLDGGDACPTADGKKYTLEVNVLCDSTLGIDEI